MTSDTPTFAVPPGFLGIGRRERDAAISIAGIPLDIGTTNRSGARFGPQAIRHASRMLVDGAHPTAWIDVSELTLSDIGDFRIALGDIPASLKTHRGAGRRRRAPRGARRRARHHARLAAGAGAAQAVRSRSFISTPMLIPGRTISVRPSRMARYSITPSRNALSIPAA